MNIIGERLNSPEQNNILVFTGERLSEIARKNLPSNINIIDILVEQEENLRMKIFETILRHSIANLFVFTAYRDLETYLLCTVNRNTKRHLIQDGANFYFRILKPLLFSRIKETLRIYSNLWRKGILLKRFVLYKKHFAQCGFIDCVWVTNPDIFPRPWLFKKPIFTVNQPSTENGIEKFYKYFISKTDLYSIRLNDYLIYLPGRLTKKNDILCEIAQLKLIVDRLKIKNVLIKLHPNSLNYHFDLFKANFENCTVIQNYIPAELYIAKAVNSYIIGIASVSLFYNNPDCKFFSLIKLHQQFKIYPRWIKPALPYHIKVVESINDIYWND
jgi:hypothetical protein